VDIAAAEDWICSHVEPAGAVVTVQEKPWATVLRVPIDGTSCVWFKACAPVQGFEPRMTAELFARWPDRVAAVLAHDEQRAWLLLADAGTPIGAYGNPPEAWLEILPLYAELQRGETEHANAHLERGVPDLRLATLPARYEELVQQDLPLDADEIVGLVRFGTRFAELCGELATGGLRETVQHDDLHMGNVYDRDGRLRVLDWGDASISHPFVSLLVTFRFLAEVTKLPAGDEWYTRLRDAYLEPWGRDLTELFALAIRVAAFAHLLTWSRHRSALLPDARGAFDRQFSTVLRQALVQPGG